MNSLFLTPTDANEIQLLIKSSKLNLLVLSLIFQPNFWRYLVASGVVGEGSRGRGPRAALLRGGTLLIKN